MERGRERGWAEVAGEREEDLNAIAAPVLGATAASWSRSSGSKARRDGSTPGAMKAAVAPLLDQAARISAALGYDARLKRGSRRLNRTGGPDTSPV